MIAAAAISKLPTVLFRFTLGSTKRALDDPELESITLFGRVIDGNCKRHGWLVCCCVTSVDKLVTDQATCALHGVRSRVIAVKFHELVNETSQRQPDKIVGICVNTTDANSRPRQTSAQGCARPNGRKIEDQKLSRIICARSAVAPRRVCRHCWRAATWTWSRVLDAFVMLQKVETLVGHAWRREALRTMDWRFVMRQ